LQSAPAVAGRSQGHGAKAMAAHTPVAQVAPPPPLPDDKADPSSAPPGGGATTTEKAALLPPTCDTAAQRLSPLRIVFSNGYLSPRASTNAGWGERTQHRDRGMGSLPLPTGDI